MVKPELIDLLGYSGKRLLPTRLLLIDGPTLVGAQRVRKSIDLNLGQPVPHRRLDDSRSKLDLLLLRQPRGFTKRFDQRARLRLVGGCRTGITFRHLRFSERDWPLEC